MRDVRRYWSDRRTIEAGLPEFVWLVSGESAAVHVPAALAAGFLQAKTHRIATEGEARTETARAQAVNAQQKKTQLQRQGIAVVAVDGMGEEDRLPESDTIRA